MKYEHLLGRPFIMGKTDCFGLFRDFYQDNFGITIRNYARPKDWDFKKLDIIEKSYVKEGFEKVSGWTIATLQPGDVLCMAIGSPTANHHAIYLGGNKILHHLVGTYSSVETMRDIWRKSTCYVLRHPEVPTVETVVTSKTLREILDERNATPVT